MHPLVALAHRLGADRRDVGPQPGLGHRERPAHLAGRHPRQVALLLLLGAVLEDQVGHDEVRVDDAAHRHPAPRDLLDDQGVGEQRLPEPAVLLGDHQAEDPHLLHALDDVGRVLVLVLELGRHRDDLLVDELAHELDQLVLLLGEAVRGLESGHAWIAAFGWGWVCLPSMPSGPAPVDRGGGVSPPTPSRRAVLDGRRRPGATMER